MDGWPLRTSLCLTAIPSAAFWARRHTEDVLRAWGLSAAVAEPAVLVVSELITNGVQATAGGLNGREQELYDRSPAALPYGRIAGLGTVRLRLARDRSRVLVDVLDRGAGAPIMQTPGEAAENGRGLLLVNALCLAWGWYPVCQIAPTHPNPPRQKGKVVWAELTAT